MRHADFRMLEAKYGIHIPMAVDYLNKDISHDFSIAQDAQPSLVTVSNSGIPAFLANYIDPELIRILVTPMKAEEIIGYVKKGDWTTLTTQFPVVESTGETSAYGDYSENGSSGTNFNYPTRQSFHFQTMTQWGEREMEMAGLGKIDYAAQLNVSSALALNKFMNRSMFFGISGLQNYGLLNDPNLSTPVTGTLWSALDGAGVYTEIVKIYAQLVTQTRGLVPRDAVMKLCMSPEIEVNLTKTNQYNVNVTDQLKKNFPNMTIETAVEYNTAGGQLVQLIVESIDNQKVVYGSFTEKLRAHPIIQQTSSWKQKKSSGTWGAIIRIPIGIAQYLGA